MNQSVKDDLLTIQALKKNNAATPEQIEKIETKVHSELLAGESVEYLLVLSGGGAGALWEWEMVKWLNAAGMKPAMICGTSAGALISFAWSKFGSTLSGRDYVDALLRAVFAENARQITAPGLISFNNGKINVNLKGFKETVLKGLNKFDIPRLLFPKQQQKILDQVLHNFLGITSLMDNAPLVSTIEKMIEMKPGFDIPVFTNSVSMRSGALIESAINELPIDAQSRVVAASTTIPLIWPLMNGEYADGGFRAGSPLSQMFKYINPAKRQRIIVLNWNRREMKEATEFDTWAKILARMGEIMLNESLQNDIDRTLDRNQDALEYGEKIGRKYVPIDIIEYSGSYGSFNFSPESYQAQKDSAYADALKFLNKQ